MDSPELGPDEALAARPKRAPEHWILFAMACAVVIGFVVLGVFVGADDRGYGTHERLGLPPCGLMALAGIPCPGCGVTTSVALAAKGRFIDSFVNQPFGLLFAFGSVGFAFWSFWLHFRGRDLYAAAREFRLGRWGLLLGAAMCVSWIYKIIQLS